MFFLPLHQITRKRFRRKGEEVEDIEIAEIVKGNIMSFGEIEEVSEK